MYTPVTPAAVSLCAALLLPQAVGLGLNYIKLGGLNGAERMTKYNRLISIEEELAHQGILGGFFAVISHPLFKWTEKKKARQSKIKRRKTPGLENTHLSLCVSNERKLKIYTNVYLCVCEGEE